MSLKGDNGNFLCDILDLLHFFFKGENTVKSV